MKTTHTLANLLNLTALLAASCSTILLCGCIKTKPAKEPLLLYCAAGLKPAIEPLASHFQKSYGVPIQIQYGGSGALLSNLLISKTGDLYLAADDSYTTQLKKEGVVTETFPVARMTPVLAVPKGNPKKIQSIADLSRAEVRSSLCSPESAALGRLVRSTLEKKGLWHTIEQQVKMNGVFKPTVGDVANDLKIGSVDAGIIWDATARQMPDIETIPCEHFLYSSSVVELAVLSSTQHETEAYRFARFASSSAGNDFFQKHGYAAGAGDQWEWEPTITFFAGSVNRRSVEGLIKKFELREGVKFNTVYNGCGILTGQMKTIRQDQGGAGFPDIYLACDRYYLENVKELFQEAIEVSQASIVLVVPKGNPKNLRTLEDLGAPGLRLAVGHPVQCTIGALTQIMLEHHKLAEPVTKNVVVQVPSSAMLVPSVITGSVDAAIAYITDTLAESDRVDTIALDSPKALAVQPFGISKTSQHKNLARRFLHLLASSPEAFESAGFEFKLGQQKP